MPLVWDGPRRAWQRCLLWSGSRGEGRGTKRSKKADRRLAVEPLEERQLLAVSPVMLGDLRAGALGSNPLQFVSTLNATFFVADDGISGPELWRTDGTQAGTALVKDIRPGSPGSAPSSLVASGSLLYFAANDGTSGTELWRSDGTAAGTYRVKDIQPGANSSSPSALTNVNGTIFFLANNGVNGTELWKSNGTDAGTVMVKDINPGAASSLGAGLTAYQNKLYFSADNGINGSELWTSDGTAAGTVMLKEIAPGTANSYPFRFLEVAGELFFTAESPTTGAELWKTDGTTAGTVLVKDVYPGAPPGDPYALTEVNGRLFFLAEDGIHGNELWVSDGTEEGTVLVKDINEVLEFPSNPDSPTKDSNADWLTNVNGVLYFQADDGLKGAELWRSDGTAGGTVLVADLNPGAAGSAPSYLTEMFDALYFSAYESTYGAELYMLSAGGLPQMVADINPGVASSGPQALVEINGTIFFAANNGTLGYEPWILQPFVLQLTNHTINENASVGTLIGTLIGNPGSGGSFSYQLYPSPTSGDNASFSIVGDKLYSNAVFDYETKNLYSVGIRANDLATGLSFWIYEPINVLDVNDAPVAVDDLYSNLVGQTLVVSDPAQGVIQKVNSLGQHDLDQDGSPLQAVLVTGAAHGTVVLNPNGTFTYTPAPGYQGRDSFTYKVNDGLLDSNVATVTINARPVGTGDSYQLNEDSSLTVPAPGVLANDVDYDGTTLTAALVTGPGHAAAFTLNANGSFFYQPVADYFGVDTFTYTANDAYSASLPVTVQLTVVGQPDAPVAYDDAYPKAGQPALVGNEILTVAAPGVLANDYNPDLLVLTATVSGALPAGNLQLNPNGSFTYTPPIAFDGGTVAFDYLLSDSFGRTDTGHVTITYQPTSQSVGIDVPAVTWEGSGTLAGQGTLTVPAWPRDLVVTLTSSDPTRVQVPATVMIPAGQTTKAFDITLLDDSVVGHAQSVQITASARGLWSSSDSTTVHDNDANRFAVSLVTPPSPPYYAGLAFPITATAYNLDNEVISNYSRAVPIYATSDAGPIAVSVNGSPAGLPFSGGVANASAAVLGLGSNVRLLVDAGDGHTGQTDPPFVVTHGPLAAFQFSPLPATEPVNAPFPVTITATDARGYPVQTYTGKVQLSGWVGSGTAPTVVVTEASDQAVDYFEIQNVSDAAVNVQGWKVVLNNAAAGNVNAVHTTKSLTPTGSLAAGELRYWTDSVSDNYFGEDIIWGSGTGKGWVMVLDAANGVRDFVAWGYSAAEIQNMAPVVDGTAVRVGRAWSGAGVTYAGAGGLSLQRFGGHDSNSADDFLWQGQTKGANNSLLVRPFAAGTGVSISPTVTANFVGGQWTGNVTVLEPAAQMYLWCIDENRLPTFSSKFNAGAGSIASGPGAYDPSTSTFYLRTSNSAGISDYTFGYGAAGAGWLPIAGDWNGDGIDTVGLYDPQTGLFYLSNSNTNPVAEVVFGFGPGNNSALPVAGDWNNDGIDTIGVYEKSTSLFYLRNSNTSGMSDQIVGYGLPGGGWLPTAGDWDGDGRDAVALYDPVSSLIYIKETLGTGVADWTFGYGLPGGGWMPFSGDWSGVGVDGPGVYDPALALYYERYSCTPGYADLTFGFGAPGWLPIAGDWNGPTALRATQAAATEAEAIGAHELQPIVAAALARWADAGLSEATLNQLRSAEIVLADLPGAQLGRVVGNRISIDTNAAGYGWFVDATPEDDREFAADANGQLRAVDARAVDRMDLVTVVAHELGHMAGLDDQALAAEGLMAGTLTPGLRRTPGAAEIDALFGTPGQNWL